MVRKSIIPKINVTLKLKVSFKSINVRLIRIEQDFDALS